MLSGESDQILLNLKMVAKIRQHERLSTRNNVAVVEKNGLMQGIWRWLHGERRMLNLQFVTEVFNRAFGYLETHPGDRRMLDEIQNACDGLRNLMITYEDDPLTVAQTQVLLDNIQARLTPKPQMALPAAPQSPEAVD